MQVVKLGGFTKPQDGGVQFWASQKDRLIELYLNQGLSTNEIGRQFYDCDGSTIVRALRRLQIPRRQTTRYERCNAKYLVDTHFFDEIDTEAKAYILGFFLADGHISTSNNLMFTIHEQDADILEHIKQAMNADHPIRHKGQYVLLNITSALIGDRLRQMGFTHRKTYDLQIQDVLKWVPNDLLRHFVRGMFDGDGSIRAYTYSYFNHPYYHLGYTGRNNVVEFIYSYFDLHTKIVDESNGISTCVSSCFADIQRIGHLLYDNATIFCHRKYQVFQQIFQDNR